ncbi:Uu.00g141900.m01.CDS01 [Anthostomella pinea]|uniref:Uu.00g141900.m01.CDS01 n=1 Tax=Anthostomella pinea TaxID=933095 RepID=A0AAI8VR63_9PEZI|nr:Uu.00g141900.m01.CDS01 [Anthostomella pinea]
MAPKTPYDPGKASTSNNVSPEDAVQSTGYKEEAQQGSSTQRYLEHPSSIAANNKDASGWPMIHNNTTPFSKEQPYAPFEETQAMATDEGSTWSQDWKAKGAEPEEKSSDKKPEE